MYSEERIFFKVVDSLVKMKSFTKLFDLKYLIQVDVANKVIRSCRSCRAEQ